MPQVHDIVSIARLQVNALAPVGAASSKATPCLRQVACRNNT